MATTATVGLTATLDITDFQKNAAEYMKILRQMQQAAQQTQTSTTSSFSHMGSLGGGVVPALNYIATGFSAIGAAAQAAAVGGVAYLTNSSITMATTFQQGMADIAATMGQTLSSVTPLTDEIKKIAVDPNLKVTLTEAASASDMLAKSGIHMQEQLDGALLATIRLQNATGESFPLAAQVGSAALDSFGLSANRLPSVIDGMVGVINNSRMSLRDLGYIFSNTGGVAKQFGVDIEQLFGIMVDTRGVFNSGRTQGTAFSEMLRQLTAPTAKASSLMAKLGIDITKADGSFKDIFTIIGEVNGILKNLSQSEQAEAAQIIFGSTGRKMYNALVGKSAESLKALTLETNRSGQAAEAAATRMDTLAGKIEIFWGIVESAQLAFGERFIPVLETGLEKINNLASRFVNTFKASGFTGIAYLLGMTPGQISMIKTVETTISTFVQTVMSSGLESGLKAIGVDMQTLAVGINAVVGAAQGLLVLGAIATGFAAVTFAMTPVGAAIIGLTTSAALLGAAWRTNFYNIQGITTQSLNFVGQSIVKASVTLNQLGTIFSTWGSRYLNKFISDTQTGIASWLGIWERGSNLLYTGLVAVFRELPQPVVQAMKQVYDIIKSGIDSALSYVNSGLSSISSMTGAAIPQISMPNMPSPAFSPTMGSDMSANITSFSTMFDAGNSSISSYVMALNNGTSAITNFGTAVAQTEPTFADYKTDVLGASDSNKKLGQSAEQAAKQIEAAREKINDNGVSMANLRGEIQTLEAQYPGLTAELIRNFNAHIAAGGSVASFGDQLGATERRQMFNYLAKLNDMDAANQALIASNGIVATSVVGTGDSFRDQYLTMATGLTPVTTATDALTTSVTTATTTSLPALATSLNETVTPAISTTGVAADTLANTQFSGLQSQISTMLNPSLGQLYTQLAEQVSPAFTQTGIKADEFKDALQRAIDKNKLFFESNNLVIVSLKNERKAVEDLIKYYDELYKAKLRAANTSGATPAPSGSSTGAPAPSQTFPQFAKGGSFVVPSGYPTTGAGMGIGVHSGELVKVFTAQQTRQMKRLQANNHISSSSSTTNDNSRVVNFNITTQQPSKSVLRDLAFAKAKYGVF